MIKKFSFLILLLLIILFSIKITSRVFQKSFYSIELNFLERAILKIDKNIVVNPYHIFKKPGGFTNFGLAKQDSIPQGVNRIIGDTPIPVKKSYLYSYYSVKEEAFCVSLVNLSNNKLIQKWSIPYDEISSIYKKWSKKYWETDYGEYVGFTPKKLSKIRMKVPTLIDNNSLIVNLQGMLLCIDSSSNLKWKHKKFFHHSLELDSDENIWSASYDDSAKKSSYLPDQIVKLDKNTGKTLYKKSLKKIFETNPKNDLSNVRLTHKDPYHLNDVQPVNQSSKYWRRGDLFLSLGNLNCIMLYRPKSNKIKWIKLSGWSYQHDVNIVNGSTISIFDNNLVRRIPSNKVKSNNRFLIYDFSKDTLIHKHEKLFRRCGISTATQGRAKFFPEDSLLYVEATNQSFFILHKLNSGSTYKCAVPGRKDWKASNLGWFRILQR
jgi:hypothetical protein